MERTPTDAGVAGLEACRVLARPACPGLAGALRTSSVACAVVVRLHGLHGRARTLVVERAQRALDLHKPAGLRR
jgi:hypothetical protein